MSHYGVGGHAAQRPRPMPNCLPPPTGPGRPRGTPPNGAALPTASYPRHASCACPARRGPGYDRLPPVRWAPTSTRRPVERRAGPARKAPIRPVERSLSNTWSWHSSASHSFQDVCSSPLARAAPHPQRQGYRDDNAHRDRQDHGPPHRHDHGEEGFDVQQLPQPF